MEIRYMIYNNAFRGEDDELAIHILAPKNSPLSREQHVLWSQTREH
jgi:hypothetical protein